MVPGDGYIEDDDAKYLNLALNGKEKDGITYKGVPSQIKDKSAANGGVLSDADWSIDSVSGATCTSKAIVAAAKEALTGKESSDGGTTPASADKTALQSKVDEVATLTETDYTADSWTALQTALAAAQSVIDSADATQTEVDAKAAALQAAINALAKKDIEAPVTPTTDGTYVLMNIPYNEFYSAEITNDVKVDVVTSATKTKTRTGSLVGGSYHPDSKGEQINGIIYPVKVSSLSVLEAKGYTKVTDSDSVTITVTNRGQTSTTTYTGKDALFENASYAYYVLSEKPAYYKELTMAEDGSLTFGAVQGEKTPLESASATITDQSNYGDYQISVTGLPKDMGNVSAVVLTTDDGTSYGLRHLENIWRKSELAFSTGFTTTSHNSPLSYDHYKAIMGQTITEIEYITQDGIYTIDLSANGLYVPVKTGITASVADGTAGDGSVTVTYKDKDGKETNLPNDFEANVSVNGIENVTYENGELSYTDAAPGSYTVTIKDNSGKYSDIAASFTLSSNEKYAEYNEYPNAPALVAATGKEKYFETYLKNITEVTVAVDGKSASYKAAGLIRDNGYLDVTADAFSGLTAGKQYNITVKSTGYPDLTFTYTVPETIYAYASLSYAEYWAAEGVTAAGSTASSTVLDSHNEADKGAFDAVSRATANHGLHRGSFQQTAVIYATTDEGKSVTYSVSSWSKDGKTIYLTNGDSIGFSKGNITYTVKSGKQSIEHTATMTGYEITGIKYVPVAIPADEFVTFATYGKDVYGVGKYNVTVNGDELSGGYAEKNLSSYAETAMVTSKTNGLKEVIGSNGNYTFGKRQTGSDSGILGAAQSTVADANITKTLVKGDGVGNYGEFIRLNLTNAGDTNEYGALGAKMQTVLWTYYGNDSTYTHSVATYGTKFAADDWMHKSMGIQLGLTDSIRAALPAGTDGTGYWSITVYALGYADYTYQFKAEAENINLPAAEPTATPASSSSTATATATPAPTAAPTATPAAATVPQTGDDSHPLALAVVCLLSAAAFAGVAVRRKRSR